MTEDQAKKKRCPFAAMRKNSNKYTFFCITSECMAWRWNGWEGADPESEPMNAGYCGLAGKL